MLISGSGIATALDVNMKTYSYEIAMALKWFRMGDGSYRASDRGTESDHISSKVSFYGTKSQIDDIIAALIANHESLGVLTLANIPEPLFGHNVDYSSTVTAVLKSIKPQVQKSLHGFKLDLELQAASLTFLNLGNTLPDLCALEYSHSGDTERTFKTNKTYNNQFGTGTGSIDINRYELDSGVFEGTFKFFSDDLASVLDFQRTTRALPFQLPTIEGVTHPFGKGAGVGPFQVKLYSVSSIKRISPDLWSAKLTFVEDF